MSVNTSAQCKLYLGTTAAATTVVAFEADTYTEVGEIEEIGEFGDAVNAVNFTSLADGRVRKFKGSYDAGELSMTVAFDVDDTGQAALKTALDDTSSDDYSVKITLNDQPSGGSNPTTFFFKGKVMSRRISVSSADNVVRASVTIAINSAVLQKDAA